MPSFLLAHLTQQPPTAHAHALSAQHTSRSFPMGNINDAPPSYESCTGGDVPSSPPPPYSASMEEIELQTRQPQRQTDALLLEAPSAPDDEPTPGETHAPSPAATAPPKPDVFPAFPEASTPPEEAPASDGASSKNSGSSRRPIINNFLILGKRPFNSGVQENAINFQLGAHFGPVYHGPYPAAPPASTASSAARKRGK